MAEWIYWCSRKNKRTTLKRIKKRIGAEIRVWIAEERKGGVQKTLKRKVRRKDLKEHFRSQTKKLRNAIQEVVWRGVAIIIWIQRKEI